MKRSIGGVAPELLVGLSALIFAVLLYLFPTSPITPPDGPNNVGFRTFEITNPSPIAVEEITYKDADKIRLDMWYPAGDITGCERKSWIDKDPRLYEGFEIVAGYPAFLFKHLYQVRANSYINAKPVNLDKKYPVVIILPGWSSISELHTSLTELLASYGFLVISIEHPGACTVVNFSDGSTYYFLGTSLPKKLTSMSMEEAIDLLASYLAKDVDYVFKFLKDLNNDERSEFYDKIDHDNVTLYGHSGGGAVALEYALKNEERISALILADPTTTPFPLEELENGLSMPVLLIESEEWHESASRHEKIAMICENTNFPSYHFRVQGTRHVDFAMVRQLSPLTYFLGETGKFMNKKNALHLIDLAELYFLNSVFFDEPISPLVQLIEKIPEFIGSDDFMNW
jgi:pimeloyl-ACP methyl ester carboxylesterase